MKSGRALAVLVIFLIMVVMMPASVLALELIQPDEVWVSLTYDDSTAGWGVTHFDSIQGAIDAVTSAGIVNVAAGTYEESLYIDKDLRLLGEGRDITIIESPDSLTYYAWGSGSRPVIAINSAVVDISGFTIDGLRKGAANSNMTGVHFWASSGSLTDCIVTGIRNETLSGGQNVVAVCVNHVWDAQIAHTVTIENNIISDYQKAGIVVNEPGATANIVGNTIIGYGPTDVIAQNGIQFGYGLGTPTNGTIINNIISANWYTGDGWGAAGVLLVGVEGVTVSGNVIDANMRAIDVTYDAHWGSEESTNIIVTNNEIKNSETGLLVRTECEVEATGNSFEANETHVSAQPDSIINLAATFANNTFDYAALIESKYKIYSTIDAINLAEEGETLVYSEAGLSLILPYDILPQEVKDASQVDIEITTVADADIPTGFKLLGSVYRFTMSVGDDQYGDFLGTMTLVFSYDPAEVDDPSTLDVYWFDGEEWIAQGGVIDTTAHTVTIEVDHWSDFALMDQDADQLPLTGSNIMWLIPLGLMLLMASAFVLRRRVTA